MKVSHFEGGGDSELHKLDQLVQEQVDTNHGNVLELDVVFGFDLQQVEVVQHGYPAVLGGHVRVHGLEPADQNLGRDVKKKKKDGRVEWRALLFLTAWKVQSPIRPQKKIHIHFHLMVQES